jgi:hypothetical protein
MVLVVKLSILLGGTPGCSLHLVVICLEKQASLGLLKIHLCPLTAQLLNKLLELQPLHCTE